MKGTILSLELQGSETTFVMVVGSKFLKTTISRPTNIRPGDTFTIQRISAEEANNLILTLAENYAAFSVE